MELSIRKMKSFTIIQKKNPVFEKCPSCFATGTIYRSHSRNWRERVVKRISFLKLYRCKQCGWRGYRSTAVLTVKSIQALLIYIGAAIIIALIVRLILSRVAS
jgi:predicted RNA-binding Zn-ribbon protein involved in translation (DUF1610 family)